jgi:hypothetical protein
LTDGGAIIDDDVISERISFLQEQIKPENKPAINDTFQLQIINILQSAGLEKLDRSIYSNAKRTPQEIKRHA